MLIVFIDTNFLLCLALKQEEHAFAYKILKLAEKGKLSLCLSTFSISEAYTAFFSKRNSQEDLKKKIDYFISQTTRSSHTNQNFQPFSLMSTAIAKKLDKELQMLDNNILRIINIAICLPYTAKNHQLGIEYRSKLNLKDEPDAFIIAAIDLYQQNLPINTQSIFVTSDIKSITSIPEVQQLMEKRHIEMFGNFKKTFDYLKQLGIS